MPPFDTSFATQVIETIALQYRKIFELVIHACWSAFEPKLTLSYDTLPIRNIHDHLQARFPDFFLQPLYNVIRPIDSKIHPSFTGQDIIQAYGVCGGLLHSSTPYRRRFEWIPTLEQFNDWSRRLGILLSFSRIKVGPDSFVYSRVVSEGRVIPEVVTWIDAGQPKEIPPKVQESLDRWGKRQPDS
jgi:hypothetical protein